jgi:hypothetical protein
MVGGCLYPGQGLLVPPLLRLLVPRDAVQMDPALIEGDVPPEGIIPGERLIGDINTAFFVLLIFSVMALIVAVHALQVESYGPGAVERIGLGVLTVLPSTVGMALFLVGYLRVHGVEFVELRSSKCRLDVQPDDGLIGLVCPPPNPVPNEL